MKVHVKPEEEELLVILFSIIIFRLCLEEESKITATLLPLKCTGEEHQSIL